MFVQVQILEIVFRYKYLKFFYTSVILNRSEL